MQKRKPIVGLVLIVAGWLWVAGFCGLFFQVLMFAHETRGWRGVWTVLNPFDHSNVIIWLLGVLPALGLIVWGASLRERGRSL